MKFEIDKTYTNNFGAKVALLYRTGNNLAFIGAMGVYYTDLEGQCADPGKSVQPPLKFEIGKHYTTKLGHKVRLEAMVQGRLVFKAAEHAYRTTMDGKAVWGHMDVVEEWKEPQAPLKLEVGKTYNTRGGGKVKLTQFTAGNTYCFEGESWWPDGSRAGSGTYTKLGEVIAGAKDMGWNLVSEDLPPTLKLEVGKYYKTRDGYRAQVVRIGAMHSSHTVVALVFDKTNPTTPVTRSYTPQGRWAVNLQESSHDLIAEYPRPKSEKLKPLEEGDIVVATAKSGRKVVRVFAGYSGEEPTVYKDGYFEGQTAGNWESVELLMKGKDI